MVFDARFLRNPHYDPILRPRTGMDRDVGAYVEADPDFERFFLGIQSLLTLVVPRFIQEGKKYATIGIGCTGGRHRSVHIAERLTRELKANRKLGMEALQVTVSHRELERLAHSSRHGQSRRKRSRALNDRSGPRHPRSARRRTPLRDGACRRRATQRRHRLHRPG